MKSFRSFTEHIPIAFLGIHRRDNGITEEVDPDHEFHGRVVPLSEYLKNPESHSGHDIGYIPSLVNSISRRGNGLEEIWDHYSKIPRDSQLEFPPYRSVNRAINNYSEGSTYLNRRLLHIDELGIDPTEFSSHKQAEDAAYMSGKHPRTAAEETHEHTTKLQNLLTSIASPDHEFHVYTGVGKNFHVNELRKHNGKIRLPAFTSTSLDPHVARSFAGNEDYEYDTETNDIKYKKTKPFAELVRIRIPPNSRHGLYIKEHSTHDHENEFLMKHGTLLRINGEPHVFVHKPEYGRQDPPFLIHDAEIEK